MKPHNSLNSSEGDHISEYLSSSSTDSDEEFRQATEKLYAEALNIIDEKDLPHEEKLKKV